MMLVLDDPLSELFAHATLDLVATGMNGGEIAVGPEPVTDNKCVLVAETRCDIDKIAAWLDMELIGTWTIKPPIALKEGDSIACTWRGHDLRELRKVV